MGWAIIRAALLLAAIAASVMLWNPIMTAGAFNGQALLCVTLWSLVLWSFWCDPNGCDR